MYPSFQLDVLSLQFDTDLLHLPMVEFLGAATLAAPFFLPRTIRDGCGTCNEARRDSVSDEVLSHRS